MKNRTINSRHKALCRAVCNRVTATIVALIALITVNVHDANAGALSNHAGEPMLEPARVKSFARRVEQTLADHGARVAFIARVGRHSSQLPAGVQYTHVAFAVYSTITRPDGSKHPGYAIYNLYQRPDQPQRSTLVQDYPYQFFAPVHTLTAGIIIPEPEIQIRLLQTITSNTYATLHNPNYSVIANPYNNKTQNCTEFTLNVLQAAIYQTNDMNHIKSVTRDHFAAMPLDINPLKLIAAATFSGTISITDHPGPAETATFGAIQKYLETFDLVKQVVHLNESNE